MNRPLWRLSCKGLRAGFSPGSVYVTITSPPRVTSVCSLKANKLHVKESTKHVHVQVNWFTDYNRKMQEKRFYYNHDLSQIVLPYFVTVFHERLHDVQYSALLRVNFLILKTCRFCCDRSGIWPLYFRAHLHAMWSS